ncbi:MAG TPA: Vms1/Ankzf1 family peptidyl-tRNA hydrolase [Gaiellaceae bacterium]|nr:Vms1/Ankzf1 family peptidyl-tRNA hydrolase [Gaiellaceae bacterium]
MAESVSWDHLRELAEFRAEKGCAISFYLNLDPHISPTAGDADTRVSSLIAQGQRSDGAAHPHLTHEQRLGVKMDFQRIGDFFEQEFSRDGTQGLAIFTAGLDNVWRTLLLAETVPDRVRVGREFHLAPLVPLVGRGDGAIVAVVGRERGHLFRLRGGRLEEIADETEERPGRHDQGGWSQARYQRHIEKLVGDHLRHVADALEHRVRRLRSPKVVVVSSDETRAEFDDLLSPDVARTIVGWTSAEAHASPAELLTLATPFLEDAETKEEAAVIGRWREESGKGGRASAGWAATLEATSDGRVDLLLYQNGVDHEAAQCPACGRLSLDGGACPLDGTEMERRDDGLDLAVHQTLAHGGTVKAVRAHHDLEPVEGIGALLRY